MKRVLFITAHRLGDAVISLAALSAMMARYPQAYFTIVCGPAVCDLFRYMPRCERLIVMEKRPYNQHWLALWRDVVRYRWEVVVDLRASLVSYGVWSRARYKVRGGRQKGLKLAQHARALGVQYAHYPTLWLGAQEQAYAATLLPDEGVWLALAITAGTEHKIWPVESFATFARQMQARGFRPLLVYGPGEREARLAAPVRALLPNVLDIGGGQYSLAQVAALIARCSLFVGGDSGLMHLAAALNVPTLGLFGPSYASQYAPSGRWAEVLLAPGPEGEGDMAALKVENVQHAALALYERARAQ
ncbi:glycosyltransferase family 9 protein [Bombella saccharophila]|uniref:Glycosyltransferase family 9 protein n=1 Tax=Bombella saccharophila TaxID=2967338 RepID=A0ABT3W5A2_9PROT|nr:glycosyltransferase family 9 protein [Bombella saccharophila]MCX5614245.1 glycosyltransferase family 9 protein [Bombella saccharophila]